MIVAALMLFLGWIGWAVAARTFAPESNSKLDRFDAIIVLGSPADRDGNPTPVQLASLTEAVREYERGVAPRLILTGAAVRNRYIEAQVMANTAEAQGVPSNAILIEAAARNTIQNACYTTRIMKSHGWRSAEVISFSSHLPRAALIFNTLPIQWRMHPAPQMQPVSSIDSALVSSLETLKTMQYLVWSDWRERCEP